MCLYVTKNNKQNAILINIKELQTWCAILSGTDVAKQQASFIWRTGTE